MARILIIAIIVAIALVGGKTYQQYLTDGEIGYSFGSIFSNSPMSKCVTKSGETYYGVVPKGITCATSKPVDILDNSIARFTSPNSGVAEQKFKCDGRQHCSQMTSCAEAEYFLNNCPNTKMDGDRDSIPCEEQWCN